MGVLGRKTPGEMGDVHRLVLSPTKFGDSDLLIVIQSGVGEIWKMTTTCFGPDDWKQFSNKKVQECKTQTLR